MNKKQKKQFMKMILVLDCLIIIFVFSLFNINHTETTNFIDKKTTNNKQSLAVDEDDNAKTTEFALEADEKNTVDVSTNTNEQSSNEQVVLNDPNIVYDGLTLEELSAKLERSLNSTLVGKGSLFANYALQLGIDPYTAVAIALHETGCKWNCSQLVKQCNNVGGQVGSPSCGTTGYKAYATLDDGIIGFMDNLYHNYYAKGLTTPETINTKYATSTTWAAKINDYITVIKAS